MPDKSCLQMEKGEDS